MTRPSAASLERYAFVALTAALSLIQLTIAGGETLFGIAVILWLAVAIEDGVRPEVPRFFLPLLALMAWTFVSTAFSPDILVSLREDKQMILYLAVPIALRVARGPRATAATNAIIAVGAVGAFVGILQGVVLGYDNLNHRPHGLLGHYMTYSGILMLVTTTAIAQLVFHGREWIWPAVAVPALIVALAVTYTRNAWVGAIVACGVLLGLRRRIMLALLPAFVVLALIVVPAGIRSRALSMFDPTNATNRDRVSMIKSGVRMIEDHPLTGVGPNMVPRAYLATYKRADAVDPADQPGSTRAHLHNVPVQLAAERGVPALLAWVWFLVVAARDLWRQSARGPARALAAGGLAAIAAMCAAGLFEHNFGDSEFLLLFLGLISLPFAAAMPEHGRASTVPLTAAGPRLAAESPRR